MKTQKKILMCTVFFISKVVVAESPFQPYWPHERYQSQSYMYTRPLFQNLAMQQSLWHSMVYQKDGPWLTGIQLTAAYQSATPVRKNKYYFLLDCHEDLLVSGDDNINDIWDRQVRAEWLSLPSNFRGKMTVAPCQVQTGVALEIHQDFCHMFDIDFLKDYWLSVVIPLVYVKNNLNLSQWNIQNPGTCPEDILQAFANPAWNFSKICGQRSVVQPADIYFRLGKAYYNKNNFQLIYYSGFVIPTSSEQDARYLFSPVAGFDGHWGMIGGVHTQILLSSDDCRYAICAFAALEEIFLLRSTQWRTFDIECKPLSRYMLFSRRHSLPNSFTPGVNVLTRKVRVRPFLMADFACGCRMKTEYFEFELGYGIWGHGDERLELKCEKPCSELNEYGIAGTAPKGYYEAVTADKSTINNQAPYDRDANGDPIFVAVGPGQLDLLSASSRSALNHKLFASLGALNIGASQRGLFGAGVYIEIPQWRTTLQTWGIWVKWGTNF